MAIDVSCACGKNLHMKDEHAGKKAKCPACGAVVVIPLKSSNSSPPAAPRATPAHPPAATGTAEPPEDPRVLKQVQGAETLLRVRRLSPGAKVRCKFGSEWVQGTVQAGKAVYNMETGEETAGPPIIDLEDGSTWQGPLQALCEALDSGQVVIEETQEASGTARMQTGSSRPIIPVVRNAPIEQDVPAQASKACPYCAEQILPAAKKCKHCGEWLDSRARLVSAGPAFKVVPAWNIPVFLFFTLNLYTWFWLYRIFRELNGRGATSTTPSQAVGYLFIPFYNFYWIFAVSARLGEALRKAHQDAGAEAPATGWVWCLPVSMLIAIILNLAAPPSGSLVAVVGLSITLCYVQSRMNKLAEAAGA